MTATALVRPGDDGSILIAMARVHPGPQILERSAIVGGPREGQARSGKMLAMQIQEARELATRHLAELGSRWAHVQAVGRLADSLAASGKVSRDVAMAAWLHDLGYAPALVRTRFHPLDGAVFLQEISAPATVVALVAHHTGAEYEAEQRGLSSALAALPKPDPTELESLLLLDLVIGPDGSPTTPSARLHEVLERYPTDDPVHRAVAASTSTLLAGAERARRRLDLPDEWPLSVAESMLKA